MSSQREPEHFAFRSGVQLAPGAECVSAERHHAHLDVEGRKALRALTFSSLSLYQGHSEWMEGEPCESSKIAARKYGSPSTPLSFGSGYPLL